IDKLDPVFLSYFAFPQGSWWTYKEVNTGKTDSIYITINLIENFLDKRDGDIRYEQLRYRRVGKFDSAGGFAIPTYNLNSKILLYQYEECYLAGPYCAYRFIY